MKLTTRIVATVTLCLTLLSLEMVGATRKDIEKGAAQKKNLDHCEICEEIEILTANLDENKKFDDQEEAVEKANAFLEALPKRMSKLTPETSVVLPLVLPLVKLMGKLEKIDGSLYGMELFVPIYSKTSLTKKFDKEIDSLPRKKEFRQSLNNKISEVRGLNGG